MHVYLDLPMHRVEHYNIFVICLNIRKQGLSKLSCSYFVKFEVCYVIIFPVLQFKMLYSFVPCSSIFSMRVRCFLA